MIPYILHVTVLITACFLFYKALLQKGTFFRLNRYTLLACVCVSFLLPLIPVPQQWSWRSAAFETADTQQPSSRESSLITPSAETNPSIGSMPSVPTAQNAPSAGPMSSTPAMHPSSVPPIAPAVHPSSIPHAAPANASTGATANPSPNASANPPSNASVSASVRPSAEVSQVSGLSTSPTSEVSRPLAKLFKALYWLYLFGVVVFGANLLLQIVVLLYQSYTRPIVQDGPFRIVETAGDRAPCSFGYNIFINPSQYDWETYNQILLHEKIHASDRHTIDILLAEILIVLQWFNPFAWLYRKEVENNLEFLTDQALLRTHEVERSAYQLSLLKVAAPNQPFGITTNYNQSLLKRRIIMMNSKSSSLHTIWRYFFLLPLLTCLVCALNKPAAFGQSMNNRLPGTNETASGSSSSSGIAGSSGLASSSGIASSSGAYSSDRREGSWFATTKDDKLCFEFKGDKDDHTWSNNTCILRSEFATLPGIGKTEFKLVREAGTLYFTGQFDGEQGYGHYSLKEDANYIQTLHQKGVEQLNDDDLLAFFLLNIRNEYIDMLQHNGYPRVSKNNIIAMTAMNIDHSYIQSWREMGYTSLSENDLIAAKAMNIDKAYIEDLHSAGYTTLAVNQLIAFKAQGIDGRYIKQLSQAQGPAMSSFPGAANADSRSASLQTTGSPANNVSVQANPNVQVTGSASVNVYTSTPRTPATPAAKAHARNAATPAIPANPANASTPPPIDDIIAFKSLNIDSSYIASLRAVGYDHVPMNDLITLRSLNIDAAYIKSFQAIGFKDVPVEALVSIKAQDITPAFINGFRSIGFKDISAEQLPTLKAMDITPAFIKGFQDIGYTDISLEQLPALKSLGITPEFVRQFRSIGYDNIPLDQLPALKSVGVTPAYVTKMKGQGFISNDLNKYIQLKSAFQ